MKYGRKVLFSACLVLLIHATGCSDGTRMALPYVPQSDFAASGTAASANMVRLAGTASGDMVTVYTVLSGPTTSSDIYSFAFDLVLGDPDVARFESGTATFGTALTLSGGQTSHVLASQSGDRITVGVTKVGGGSGNGITGSDKVILTLQFRMLTDGSTTLAIEGSPPHNPAAIDSTGTEIPSVVFDAAPALLTAA